ncbi:type I restriction modification DNA specificity domain protein [Corynebacterium efficiens YS-314]|uniref:Putative type I restriction-modification system subunit S n=1 Tax=Corynebacterium efficiens (strain DSM 44549 / YS-314 / AJ 12310 / JCM 11189 / NBRC 100395) TaxID=196164 RepID=Q8FN20_COREF|nr:restriction endonuclease subunit S [Corynebacterium efficiens]EEW48995.1 type I restriction modification DNA specificity domain protein [Corynebacterium efficiens YS-314]BAC19138.1 putative type I restriction-modification system subunit S [Corynebacterium efficiens YS-314]
MSQLVQRRLTDLLSFIVDNRGRTCPTSETGIPLIATNCVKDDELYPVFEKVRFVDETTYETWFRAHPEPGDILFVCKGSPGRTALVPDPVSFCIAQDMVALRVDPTVVNNRYLYYMLQSQKTRHQIENMHVGTMIPHFKKGDFPKLVLSVHADLGEQQAIAEVLGALDDKIAANSACIRLIDEHLAAEYERTLQQGEVVEELGVIAEFHNKRRIPLSAKQRDERPGAVPYYGASGVFGYVNEAIFDEPLVLVGEDGSVINSDGTPVIQYIWGPSWVNNHAHALKGKLVSTELLYYAIRRSQVSTLVTGAVQPKINMGNLKRLQLALPAPESRTSTEAIIAAEVAAKRAFTTENRTLVATRDALLPQLMSGNLRVKDAEKIVKDAF